MSVNQLSQKIQLTDKEIQAIQAMLQSDHDWSKYNNLYLKVIEYITQNDYVELNCIVKKVLETRGIVC